MVTQDTQHPTVERLRELFDYDAETGALTWRPDLHYRGRRGVGPRSAGTPSGNGYLHVSADGEFFQVHQIAWAIVHGVFVKNVGHRNDNRQDNRLTNLREMSCQQRSWNAKTSRRESKTSRFKGVSWSNGRQKWCVQISLADGRRKNLGRFKDEIEAAKVYDTALRKIAGPYARTNFPTA
jgi:hypothetical protein